MPVTDKSILTRLYVVAGFLFLFAAVVLFKLVSIQMVHGDKYRDLALKRTEKMFTIAPNRGNLYSDDGSLLATSVSKYTIRFDAVTVNDEDFKKHIKPLSRFCEKQKPIRTGIRYWPEISTTRIISLLKIFHY